MASPSSLADRGVDGFGAGGGSVRSRGGSVSRGPVPPGWSASSDRGGLSEGLAVAEALGYLVLGEYPAAITALEGPRNLGCYLPDPARGHPKLVSSLADREPNLSLSTGV